MLNATTLITIMFLLVQLPLMGEAYGSKYPTGTDTFTLVELADCWQIPKPYCGIPWVLAVYRTNISFTVAEVV